MSISSGPELNPQAAAAMGQLRVELDRLQETSDELEREVAELRGAADRLRGNPNFGDSRVHAASPLWERHQMEVLPAMQDLVREINGGLRAGERVLREVARRYQEADNTGTQRMEKELERLLEGLPTDTGNDVRGP